MKAEVEYSVGGRVVHRASEDRRKELEYADFFDQVVRRFGQERLLHLVGRIEGFRKAARGAHGTAAN